MLDEGRRLLDEMDAVANRQRRHGAQTSPCAMPASRGPVDLAGLRKPWSANAVRVLDPHGREADAALPLARAALGGRAGHGCDRRHWAALLAAGRLDLR